MILDHTQDIPAFTRYTMVFQCRDCSHKGKQFPQGACPACGSRNVARVGGRETEEEKPPGKLGLVICAALWIGLAVVIAQKFL